MAYGTIAALLVSLALSLAPMTVAAQRNPGTPGTRGQQAQTAGQRDALESQLEQRLAEMVRRELKLTDDQMRRLAEVNQRIDADRRSVLMRERRARIALRSELEGSGTPNDARVSALLDEMLAVQQERVRLTQAEQRALTAFLSPVQRARYLGLQEGFRRRMEERRHEADAARRRGGESKSRAGTPPDRTD